MKQGYFCGSTLVPLTLKSRFLNPELTNYMLKSYITRDLGVGVRPLLSFDEHIIKILKR